MPIDLTGLRVRRVDPAIRESAHSKLKALVDQHGKNINPRALAGFKTTLRHLLLDGLRVRQAESAPEAQNTPERIYFTSSGKVYSAPVAAWPEIQKRDPGAKRYAANKN